MGVKPISCRFNLRSPAFSVRRHRSTYRTFPINQISSHTGQFQPLIRGLAIIGDEVPREFAAIFAFGGDKVWKRIVKSIALGAFSALNKIKVTPL